MAQAVVDGLEVVQIQVKQPQALAVAFRMGQCLLEPVAKQGSVWNFRQGVKERQRLNVFFRLLVLGDVALDAYVVSYRSSSVIYR